MQNTVLFAGKDSPAEFINVLSNANYRVAVATGGEAVHGGAENVVSLRWNRSSPISARSILVETEKALGTIGTAILCFDAPFFARKFTECDVETISQAVDSLVAGFQYLAVEAFTRFSQKKSKGRLVFLVKRHAALAEAPKLRQQKNSDFQPASPIVAAAQAAFCSFAENFAVLSEKNEFGSVVLASHGAPKASSATDGEIAQLLLEHLRALDSGDQPKRGAKNPSDWARLGAKGAGFLARFR